MIKAKVFWDKLCSELGYRFFTGVPIAEFKVLYKAMGIDFMHFIPAIDETRALGIISGASLSGVKGSVLMSSKAFDSIKVQVDNFNTKYNIPILFIVEDTYNPLELEQFEMDKDLNILNSLVDYLHKSSAILVLKEGVIL